MRIPDSLNNGSLGLGVGLTFTVINLTLLLIRSWPRVKKAIAPIIAESTQQPARLFATTVIALALAFGLTLLMVVDVEDERYRVVAMGIAAIMLAAQVLQTFVIPVYQGLKEQNERLEDMVQVYASQTQLLQQNVATLDAQKQSMAAQITEQNDRFEELVEFYAAQTELLQQRVAELESPGQSKPVQKQLPPPRKPSVRKEERQTVEATKPKQTNRRKKTKKNTQG